MSYHVIIGIDMFDIPKETKDNTNHVCRKLATNKWKPMKNLELKKISKGINDLLEGFNSELVVAEEKLRPLEERSERNIQTCA